MYLYINRVEDHDDLTPIFNRHSDMLTKTYGNFFLAEMIEAQDEGLQCIVAEVDSFDHLDSHTMYIYCTVCSIGSSL